MNKSDIRLLLLILVAAGLAAAFWLLRDQIMPAAEVAVAPQAESGVATPATPVGPLHPMTSPELESRSDRDLVPLPALDDSDSYFLLALVATFGRDIEGVLVRESLIDKFVATVDNLPRDHVAEKIRPVGKLASLFAADTVGEDDFYLGAENFARYDRLVRLIEGADHEAVVAMYRRFYPLLQESYERLGYPDGYFNDRVVEVIDHLLATPAPSEPVRLVRPHVLYEFADPELRALSSGQKLLLRVGNVHATIIKSTLRSLRALITGGLSE